MPYIEQGRRALARVEPKDVGELTFLVQQIVKGYVARKGESYQVYAEVLGALRGAELDLWTRRLGPYEHDKCSLNGDVW